MVLLNVFISGVIFVDISCVFSCVLGWLMFSFLVCCVEWCILCMVWWIMVGIISRVIMINGRKNYRLIRCSIISVLFSSLFLGVLLIIMVMWCLFLLWIIICVMFR